MVLARMVPVNPRPTDPAAVAALAPALAPALWEAASAAARGDTSLRVDSVEELLQPSATYRRMLEELGPGWVIQQGNLLQDAIDEVRRLITVCTVQRDEPQPGGGTAPVEDHGATAAKVVASVAEVLRRRECRDDLPSQGLLEPADAFAGRLVAARSGVEADYYLRLLGVTSDVYGARLAVSQALRGSATAREDPPPIVAAGQPPTPGLTAADLPRFAAWHRRDGAAARGAIAADIAARPEARAAFLRGAA
ncbi:hypothetical protein ACE7GA_22400 [Roseomonas sp. CCTCC AB2023176]|uniref:hypothetical protein n=1 Tax=Roseomonas sp. CCTCC AB2023176 TaxID=3342640 RepID=UPI0035E231E7